MKMKYKLLTAYLVLTFSIALVQTFKEWKLCRRNPDNRAFQESK